MHLARLLLFLACPGLLTACKVGTTNTRSGLTGANVPTPVASSKITPSDALIALFDRPAGSLKVGAMDPSAFDVQLKKVNLAARNCGEGEIELPQFFADDLLKTFDQSNFLNLSVTGYLQGNVAFAAKRKTSQIPFGLTQEQQPWQWTLSEKNRLQNFPMPKPPSFKEVSLKTDGETSIPFADPTKPEEALTLPSDRKFTLSWSLSPSSFKKKWVYAFVKDRKNHKRFCLFDQNQTSFAFAPEGGFPVNSFSLSLFLVSYFYNSDENILLMGSDHRHIHFR